MSALGRKQTLGVGRRSRFAVSRFALRRYRATVYFRTLIDATLRRYRWCPKCGSISR